MGGAITDHESICEIMETNVPSGSILDIIAQAETPFDREEQFEDEYREDRYEQMASRYGC